MALIQSGAVSGLVVVCRNDRISVINLLKTNFTGYKDKMFIL